MSIWITEVDAPSGDGPTLAVKDLFDTAGVRTTYGSTISATTSRQRPPPRCSGCSRRRHVMAGKANLHEYAWGITSQNTHHGRVSNPAAPGRIAGGSSGGSAAAVAAGLVERGLGSDTGGSIRIPAACCGVAGFKPSCGAVPIDGCCPLSPRWTPPARWRATSPAASG